MSRSSIVVVVSKSVSSIVGFKWFLVRCHSLRRRCPEPWQVPTGWQVGGRTGFDQGGQACATIHKLPRGVYGHSG